MSDPNLGRASALFEGEGTIRVVPWPDPVADGDGFSASSAMVEWCWLPVVGPSGAWAYRRLVSALVAHHGAYDLDLAELAHWLGLGAGVSPNAPVSRTLLRLVRFGLCAVVGSRTLAVRRTAPPLRSTQLERLNPRIQRVHTTLLAQLRADQAIPVGQATAVG
jgi:hypothetical protein